MSVELPVVHYEPDKFVTTNQGNKVSKNAKIQGGQNIVLAGYCVLMEDSIIRGDLCTVHVGNFCFLGARSVIRPGHKYFKGGINYFPIRLSNRIVVGEDSVVSAAEVGSFVYIGRNVVVGQSAVIKDCSYIKDNSVLPADSVIPPFSIVAGNPAKVVGQMPVNTNQLMTDITNDLYHKLLPKTPAA